MPPRRQRTRKCESEQRPIALAQMNTARHPELGSEMGVRFGGPHAPGEPPRRDTEARAIRTVVRPKLVGRLRPSGNRRRRAQPSSANKAENRRNEAPGDGFAAGRRAPQAAGTAGSESTKFDRLVAGTLPASSPKETRTSATASAIRPRRCGGGGRAAARLSRPIQQSRKTVAAHASVLNRVARDGAERSARDHAIVRVRREKPGRRAFKSTITASRSWSSRR